MLDGIYYSAFRLSRSCYFYNNNNYANQEKNRSYSLNTFRDPLLHEVYNTTPNSGCLKDNICKEVLTSSQKNFLVTQNIARDSCNDSTYNGNVYKETAYKSTLLATWFNRL